MNSFGNYATKGVIVFLHVLGFYIFNMANSFVSKVIQVISGESKLKILKSKCNFNVCPHTHHPLPDSWYC